MMPPHRHMTRESLQKYNFMNKHFWTHDFLKFFNRNSPLQMRLHGSNGPIRSGRHSGSKIEQTNSCDRFEHFDSIKY